MDPFLISAGIQAASGLFKGIGGFFGGNAQAKAAKAAARQAGLEGGIAASQQLQQGDAAAAEGAVQAAANGGGFTGSSLGVIQMLSERAMFNARAAAYRGATEVQSHLYDARVAKQQGLQGLIGGFSGAAGDIFGGMAKSKLAKLPPAPGGGGAAPAPGTNTLAGASDLINLG